MIESTGVLILSKGKIADRIPIFFKVFYIVSHTPILPFERIKTSVCSILKLTIGVIHTSLFDHLMIHNE